MTIVDKAWELQWMIEERVRFNREKKIERYNRFKKNPGRKLPSLDDLIVYRKWFVGIAGVMFCLLPLQSLLFPNTLITDKESPVIFGWLQVWGIPFILQVMSMAFFAYAAVVDKVIYKRFGKKECWLPWDIGKEWEPVDTIQIYAIVILVVVLWMVVKLLQCFC